MISSWVIFSVTVFLSYWSTSVKHYTKIFIRKKNIIQRWADDLPYIQKILLLHLCIKRYDDFNEHMSSRNLSWEVIATSNNDLMSRCEISLSYNDLLPCLDVPILQISPEPTIEDPTQIQTWSTQSYLSYYLNILTTLIPKLLFAIFPL